MHKCRGAGCEHCRDRNHLAELFTKVEWALTEKERKDKKRRAALLFRRLRKEK